MPSINAKNSAACLLTAALTTAAVSDGPDPNGEDPSVKFAGYATVVQGFECDLVATLDGSIYAIENLGSFEVGDCVYIEGTLAACDRTCTWHETCILDNGIAPCCRGDVTRDFVVDVDDLIAVVLEWGCSDKLGACTADVNADQRVDVLDVLEVITNWGSCAIP